MTSSGSDSLSSATEGDEPCPTLEPSKPVLPLELYRLVIDSLDCPRTLYTLLFVNHALYTEARRAIYGTIHRWEAGDALLNRIAQSVSEDSQDGTQELASVVHAISLTVSTADTTRNVLINDALKRITGIRRLTLTGVPGADPMPLLQGCAFNLISLRISSWSDHLRSIIEPLHLLQVLDIDLTSFSIRHLGEVPDNPAYGLIEILNSATSLSELKIQSFIPGLSMTSLLAGCSFQLHILNCRDFPPDPLIPAFIDRQPGLETVSIQSSPEHWPALATSIRRLPKLRLLKIYTQSGLLDISPLLGASFHLTFIRLRGFLPEPEIIANFLETQPSLTTLPDHDILRSVELPLVTSLYAGTQTLMGLHRYRRTRPLILYWMRGRGAYRVPTEEQVDKVCEVVGELRSFAAPWPIPPEALEKMYELHQIVTSLPLLQALRIVQERDFRHDVFAAGLFKANPSLRRISVLENQNGGETWSRTYCRNNLPGIVVPEPKSHDLLIREFRDTTWTRGVGAKSAAIAEASTAEEMLEPLPLDEITTVEMSSEMIY